MGFFVIKLFCTVFFLNCFIYADPEVTIEEGTLRGIVMKTWKQKEFYGFMGIPYAKPPVGKLRFAPPVPVSKWSGILDASKPGSVCTQYDVYFDNYEIEGSEDCLFLNIYTPKIENSSILYPVMVFIHGGGFMAYDGNPYFCSPSLLLEKDVVLVTMNYRLGPLGFLSTGDNVVPGNNGLKDQSLCLKWIQRNIDKFNGDANKVTLFGQSAGGSSVHFHLVSPLSRGLFNYAIAHSGISTASWALQKDNRTVRNSKRLAEYLNCPIENSSDMIECLRATSASDITAMQKSFMTFSFIPMVPFKPVIEPSNDHIFLPRHPYEIINSDEFMDIPFMTGFTKNDGAAVAYFFYKNSSLIEKLNQNFTEIAPLLFEFPENLLDKEEIGEKIKSYYFGEDAIDETSKSRVGDLITDSWTLKPMFEATKLQIKHMKAPVYQFMFGYRHGVGFCQLSDNDKHDYGVCHYDDMFYLFGSAYFKFLPQEHEKMVDIMTTLWTNFATYGNPTPNTNSLIKNIWEPAQENTLKYCAIFGENNITMSENTHLQDMQFWEYINID